MGEAIGTDRKSFDWRSFEKRVKRETILAGQTCIKVPENMRLIGSKVVYQKTEFDYCASISGIAAFFDCKCMAGSLFNFRSYVLREEKVHQWRSLNSALDRIAIAGYLIYFYEHQRIAWASVPVVHALINQGDKSLTLSSTGVVSQADHLPVDLLTLMSIDRARVLKQIGG